MFVMLELLELGVLAFGKDLPLYSKTSLPYCFIAHLKHRPPLQETFVPS